MRRLTSPTGQFEETQSSSFQGIFFVRACRSLEILLAIVIAVPGSLFLTGCATQGSATTAAIFDPENPGTVMGGLQPVTHSSLQVYAVDISGGSVVTRTLLQTPIFTNSAGNFSIWGKFTCPDPTSQIYLTATGGNPGLAPGTDNPNILLLSALGPCGDITATTPVVINEVTTVAGAAAGAPYFDDASPSYVHGTQADLESAFHLATNFANAATGTAPGTGVPAGFAVPASTINTLANLVASCVYTTGGSAGDGTPCGKLFTDATEPKGTAPTSTLTALFNILNNPTRNVDALYKLVAPPLAAAETLPFAPQLAAAPATWSINLVGEAATPAISATTAPGEVTFTLSDAYPTAILHYTLDGSHPTALSPVYTGPVVLKSSKTVNAIAIVGTDLSSVASHTFTVAPVATRLVFVAQPQSTLTTSTFSASIAFEDEQGNIIPTATESVTISAGGDASGFHAASFSEAPVGGVATFSGLTFDKPGDDYTLVAEASGLPLVASARFEISVPFPGLPSTRARSAASFVSSIGINTHFNYYGSIYTNDTPLMIRSLQALGIVHLRDAMCWQGPQTWNTYYTVHQQLGALGFKTDFIAYYNQPASEFTAYPALVTDAEAVEPANEYDISGDQNWVADITAQQQLLYNTIKASPYAGSLTVLAPSLAYPTNAPALGNVDAMADAGNLHGYFGGENPGGAAMNPATHLRQMVSETPDKPVWVTETGYFAQSGPFAGSYGVDLETQATYIPRTLLEYFNAGAARTYLYELADDFEPGEDPANYHWGLLDSNGAPKSSFHAVVNLMSTLADTVMSFTPSDLAFNLEGAGSTVHHTLLQKGDGTFYLAIWIEDASYDALTRQAIAVPSQHVKLQLNVPLASAESIQWDGAGAITATPLTPAASIPLTLTEKLQIVKLTVR